MPTARLRPRAGRVLAVLLAQAAPSPLAPAGLRLRADVTMHFWQGNPARSWLPQQQQEKGLFQAEGSHRQQIRQEELRAGFSFLCKNNQRSRNPQGACLASPPGAHPPRRSQRSQ